MDLAADVPFYPYLYISSIDSYMLYTGCDSDIISYVKAFHYVI